MLGWFEKVAPIRAKFSALLVVLTSLSTLSLIGAVLVWLGFAYTGLGIGLAALALTVLTIGVAKGRVCNPYVNTVLRMEALAGGTSPVRSRTRTMRIASVA